MTACCVSGYRPLRGIRLDECDWPPRLFPAGPWKICDCAEGMIVLRQRSESVIVEKTGSVGRTDEPMVVHRDPTCSTCPGPPAQTEPVIEWHEHWQTWLCPECGAVLAEEETR